MKCCSCVYRNGSNGGARGGKLKAEPAEGLTTESLPHRTFAGGLRRHGQERGAFDGARSRSEAAAGAGAGTALRELPSVAFRTPDRRNRRVEASGFSCTSSPKEISSSPCADCSGSAQRFAALPASAPISATITLAAIFAHSRDGHESFDGGAKGSERSLYPI